MSINLCHDCSATQVVIFQEASYFIPRRLSTSVYRLSLYVLAGRFWDIVPFVKPIPLTCVNAIKRGTFASKRRYRTTLNGHRGVYPPPPKYVNCKYNFRITTANVPPLFRQFASGQRYVARTHNSRIRRATNSANRVSSFEQIRKQYKSY